MEFEEYLKSELEKPVGDYYDPEGNSPRATVVRGLRREIVRQYKEFPAVLMREFREFCGLETPIGWFLQMTLVLLLSPVLPAVWGCHWHKKSIAEYRSDYERKQNT